MSDDRLIETDELTALREDHERLRSAFAECLGHERLLREQLATIGPSNSTSPPASVTEKRLAAELAQTREDLERVLHSPSWKVGSAATALPRWLRDRWIR